MLALIPARGGSKGLPGKNIMLLLGKPLIQYSIDAALGSGVFNRVIVSTDADDIRDIALAGGAEVPFIRPDGLASDSASSMDVIIHALSWLEKHEGYKPSMVSLLQPTSPLRSSDDIISAWKFFRERNAKRLVGLVETGKHPEWMFSIENDRIVPLTGAFPTASRRQDLKVAYALNGALYMAQCDVLLREGGFLGPDTVGYVMPKLRSIDIDDAADFLLAEAVLERNLVKQKN